MALSEEMQVEVMLEVRFSSMENKTKSNNEAYRGGWIEGVVKIVRKGFCYICLKNITDYKEKSLVKVKWFIRNRRNSLLEVYLEKLRPTPPYKQ